MKNKGLTKAKRCLKLKKAGKTAAARRAGCTWPSRARGRSRSTKARRRSGALRGHVRTCAQYQCVKGRGKKNPEGACKKGYVLRCFKYVDDAGIPRTVATRKPYQEFTYGRYNRGDRGARALIEPKLTPTRMKALQKRRKGLPKGAVKAGPGRK